MKTVNTGTLETQNVLNYFEAIDKTNSENLLNDSPEAVARVQEIRSGLTDVERQLFDDAFNPRLKEALRVKRSKSNSKWANRVGMIFAGTFVTLFTAGTVFIYAGYGTSSTHNVGNNSSGESSSVSVW